jgi:hypothetical protein
MSILARLTIANLMVWFRRSPSHNWFRRSPSYNESDVFPPDEPMVYQVPEDWLDAMATWAKMMMVVIALAFAAGYLGGLVWVALNPGYFSL